MGNVYTNENSYTVVVINNETGDVSTTSEWECPGDPRAIAAATIAAMVASGGMGDVTIAVHYHNA
jgi:hypothetical protein